MIDAICHEIALRRNEMKGQSIQTIYFGGGTPSLLSYEELMQLFDCLQKYYDLGKLTEITLEANPDDFTKTFLEAISKSPVNRLSIGIQSFFDDDLRFMNRAHNSNQADSCVKSAQDKGLENITIDLIYAIPESNLDKWKKNVEKAIQLHVPHISSYCMTIEERTTFGNWERNGKLSQIPDEAASEQYLHLVSALKVAGINQYEISNFSKAGFESNHNSNYWTGEPYLGIGPSAHSFDGLSKRRWNVANNTVYLKKIYENDVFWENEILTSRDRYNETVMTMLRTKKGISLAQLKETFHIDLISIFEKQVNEILQDELALIENDYLRLTTKGLFVADKIASDFFLLEELK